MDYGFMCKTDEEKQINPYFVMVDSKTGDRFARAIPHKGLGHDGNMDWLVKEAVEELKYWGHNGGASGHIRIKSDGEASIRSIRLAIAKLLGGRVVHEETPVGESESNGRAEASIKIVRQYTRIYMDQLQMNTRKSFAPNHVIRQWAVRWGAMAPSRYLRGKDKKTPYQRRTGRAFTQPICMFGESIFY